MHKALFLLLNCLVGLVACKNCSVEVVRPETATNGHLNLGLNSVIFYTNFNLTGSRFSLNLTDGRCFNTDFTVFKLADAGYNCFEAYSEEDCTGTMWYFVPGRIHTVAFQMRSIVPCRFDDDVQTGVDEAAAEEEDDNKTGGSDRQQAAAPLPAAAAQRPEVHFFKSFFTALCRPEWVAEMTHRNAAATASVRDPRFISWDFLYDAQQKTFMDVSLPTYRLPEKNSQQYRDVLLAAIYILQNHKRKISAEDEFHLRDYARRVVSVTDTGVQNRWCSILFLKAIIELIHT